MNIIKVHNTKHAAILLVICVISVSIYLLTSAYTFRTGFPLDDAWIHQTYARNLGLHGEWSFITGERSAGSTSPLWTLLLAIGFILKLGPYLWTYLLGWVLLFALGVFGYEAFIDLTDNKPGWALGAGVILVLEWHLVWAAVSGMETLLFSFLVFLILVLIDIRWNNWVVLGWLIGVSLWVRPDGITLVIPALFAIGVGEHTKVQKREAFTKLIFGLICFLIPYLLFNRYIGDTWLPNTFFAKQAEYAIELTAPLWSRLLEQAVLPLVGVGVCLLPGFIRYCWKALKEREWIKLLAPLWGIGYLCIYALRLPVTYQHGRYVIPMMPIYFFFSWLGMAEWVDLRSPKTWKRIVSRAWVISVWIVLVAFFILGARAYGRDVAVIESEMVTTANWVARNTKPDSLVAAHDIGALGYFGERNLLDLAGLISPEVIPFIRDEAKLALYLSDRGADYLVTFPGWYPKLIQSGEQYYSSQGQYSPAQGGENMVVYKWLPNP